VHRRVKIRYVADPRAVHDREPDVDRHHPRPVRGFGPHQDVINIF
jgi:hypothetical protein